MKIKIQRPGQPDKMINTFSKCVAWIEALSRADRNKVIQALQAMYWTEGIPTRLKAKRVARKMAK